MKEGASVDIWHPATYFLPALLLVIHALTSPPTPNSVTETNCIAMKTDPVTTEDTIAGGLRTYAHNPQTVLRFLDDISPATEPVDDYITDVEERCNLFGKLQQLHCNFGVPMPNVATLAFFMVAPVPGIRGHLERLRDPGQASPRCAR